MQRLEYENYRKPNRLALALIETRTDEIIMIATSCFLWKKKLVRVETSLKNIMDMPIL